MQQLGCFGFSGVEEASLGGLQYVPCGVSSGFWPILYVSWISLCLIFRYSIMFLYLLLYCISGIYRTPFCPTLRSPRLWVTETLLFSPCMDDVCIILMHASTFMFYFSSPSARGLYFFLSPAPRVLYIFLSPDSRGLYFFCPQSFRAITFFISGRQFLIPIHMWLFIRSLYIPLGSMSHYRSSISILLVIFALSRSIKRH